MCNTLGIQASATTRLLTNHIFTMTELRKPHKIRERSRGKPVAIPTNSQLVGYLVTDEATDKGQHRYATRDEAMESQRRARYRALPVLDHLRGNQIMSDWLLPSANMVETIHDAVLNPGELSGRALDKSGAGTMARPNGRVTPPDPAGLVAPGMR